MDQVHSRPWALFRMRMSARARVAAPGYTRNQMRGLENGVGMLFGMKLLA